MPVNNSIDSLAWSAADGKWLDGIFIRLSSGHGEQLGRKVDKKHLRISVLKGQQVRAVEARLIFDDTRAEREVIQQLVFKDASGSTIACVGTDLSTSKKKRAQGV